MNLNCSNLNFRTTSVTPYATPNGIGATVQRNNTRVDAQVGLGSSGITGGSIGGQVDHSHGSTYGGAGFDSKGHFSGGSVGTSINSGNGTTFGNSAFDSKGHFSGGSVGGSLNGNSGSISFNHKGDPTGVSVGTSKDSCTYSASVNKDSNGGVSGGVSVRCDW